MPGLVGFVTPEISVTCAEALLSRMAAALGADEAYQSTLYHEGGAGLGRVGLSDLGSNRTAVWNKDHTRCLVMEGELYDMAAVEASVFGSGGRPDISSQAALVLALYERFGERVIATLNGAFLVALWDRRARELVIFNDRLGLFPLYYARVNDGLLFASGELGASSRICR